MAAPGVKLGLAKLSEDEELEESAAAALPAELLAGARAGTEAALIQLADLTVGAEIGHGGFSRVYRGTWNGRLVAIKRMPLADKDAMKYLGQELAVLKAVAHAHLIQYFGAALKGREVYIVTEFMEGGDLSTVLSRRTAVPLPWRLRARMARDAIDGIVALHEAGCIHRDVKTENFLVDDTWRVVVADYGFARKNSRSDVAMTICGTDEFMAPEVVFGEVYDEKADVFSFGVFLCELICRRVPGAGGFLHREPRTKFKLNMEEFRAAVPPDAPSSLVELAAQCCTYEAEYRMTSEVSAARTHCYHRRRRRCRRRRHSPPPPLPPITRPISTWPLPFLPTTATEGRT